MAPILRDSAACTVFRTPTDTGHTTHIKTLLSLCAVPKQANEAKYRQTESTPFMTHPLVQDVQHNGITLSGQAILQGNYLSGGLEELLSNGWLSS